MCFYHALIVVTFIVNYATRKITVLLYGEDLGGNPFSIEIEATINIGEFLNMDGTGCNLQKKEGGTVTDTLRR